jgi:hypothetical protein
MPSRKLHSKKIRIPAYKN